MSLLQWFRIFLLVLGLTNDAFWNDSSLFPQVTALLATPTSSTKRSHRRKHHAHDPSLQTSVSDQFSEEAANCFPNAIPVTEEDRLTLQRQTGQIAPSVAAIGVPSNCQCQHGYPQVYLLNPLVIILGGEKTTTTKRMNSGLLKLTCPLLVNAIDQLEDDGYIANFTAQVTSNEEWKESCQTRHRTHANARKAILEKKNNNNHRDDDDDPMLILQQKLGDRGAEAFVNSGIAGATIEKPDVKCLHAWMGDYLFFHHTTSSSSSSSAADEEDSDEHHYLGEAIAAALEQREIPLSGKPECHQYCSNPAHQSASFAPPKARNKQRLKTQKEKDRRKRKKEREQG